MASGNLMELETIQSKEFKALIGSLCNFLNDVTFVFDESGIKFNSLSCNGSILTNMFLQADNFESYQCRGQIPVSFDINEFYKVISCMEGTENLSLYVKENDPDKFWVKIRNSATNKEVKTMINIKDMDYNPLPLEGLDINKIVYRSTILLPSKEYNKTISYISNFTDDYFDIIVVNGSTEFKYKTAIENISGSIVYHNGEESANTETTVADEGDIIQGRFPIKYMSVFSKCISICSNVKMEINNDKPLKLNVCIGNLGELDMYISPVYEE